MENTAAECCSAIAVATERETEYPEERLFDSDEFIECDAEFLESDPEDCDMEMRAEEGADKKADSNSAAENSKASFEDDESTLFMVSLVVSLRDFKGQTSAGELDTWLICGNSVENFLSSVWEQSKKHLIRQVVTVHDDDGNVTYKWSPNKEICEADFVHFALFYDKQNRRTITVDKLSTNVLQNWRKKSTIELLLHKYSLTVNSKTSWKKVEKALIDVIPKNRGGAVTTEFASDLAHELRRKHGHIWNGHDIAWSIWANTILAAPAHQHEAMKEDSTPPGSCMDLFAMKENEQFQRIRREYRVAHNVNDGYQADIKKVMDAFTELKEAQQQQTVKLSVLERRLENLALRSQIGDSFISSAESAMNVRENEFSSMIASRVQDVEDVDHM
ncbi:uncharacterized protein LOC134225808 [Armigeres subalbatus]|uniref:uncharacterized protein LOC134225808 n=1 Tax=Armigeres subalbatus TaxID=124917 RepID=UPI002ED1CABD